MEDCEVTSTTDIDRTQPPTERLLEILQNILRQPRIQENDHESLASYIDVFFRYEEFCLDHPQSQAEIKQVIDALFLRLPDWIGRNYYNLAEEDREDPIDLNRFLPYLNDIQFQFEFRSAGSGLNEDDRVFSSDEEELPVSDDAEEADD